MRASYCLRLMLCLFAFLLVPAYAAVQVGDPAGSFDISGFQIEGATLLDPSALQAAVAGFAGKGRDFSYVERAMAALEKAYRKHGFNLVKVILPEQELQGGMVRLRVVEARLGQVRVIGNRFHSEVNIRNSLPAVMPGTIPDTRAISANLAMANENPSKKVELELQSAAQPGVVDAVEECPAPARLWSSCSLGTEPTPSPSAR